MNQFIPWTHLHYLYSHATDNLYGALRVGEAVSEPV